MESNHNLRQIRKTADLRDREAQYDLARLYEDGIGVERDIDQLEWVQQMNSICSRVIEIVNAELIYP